MGTKMVIHIKPVSSHCLQITELPFPLVAFPGLQGKSNETWSWLFSHLYCFLKWKLWNDLLWNNLVFFLEMTLQWTRQTVGLFWSSSNPVNSKRVSRGSSLSCSFSSVSLRWYWKMIRYFIHSWNDVEFECVCGDRRESWALGEKIQRTQGWRVIF